MAAAGAVERPEVRRNPGWTPGGVLVAAMGVSLAVPLALLLLSRTWLSDWRWSHVPLHSTVEALGAFIALAVVPLLMSQERRGEGSSHNRSIAAALAGMGALDGVHALAQVGHGFVWTHSLATLVGGALLATVWVPQRWARHLQPAPIAIACLAVGGLSLLNCDQVPTMIRDGEFTAAARALNLAGGVFLFAAALGLARTFRRTDNPDDALFVVHCVLFSAAALLFEQSALWDAAWWGWHLLRLCAYAVALLFVVVSLRVEEELAARAVALQAANEELQRFAYVASHDLKEPLRSVAAYCQLLSDEYADRLDEQGLRWLLHARAGADKMQELVDELLAYTRLDSGSRPFEPVALSDVLTGVQAQLNGSIRDRGAIIEVTGPLPVVHGDPVQLRQLMANLLSNAIKFCREVPRVTVFATLSEGGWRVEITDNGIGIPPAHRERVFALFKRLVPQHEFPGTGIGLATCRRVVERHGGRIWVADPPPDATSGTRVCFELPRHEETIP